VPFVHLVFLPSGACRTYRGEVKELRTVQ
jgi:hypothetical protein